MMETTVAPRLLTLPQVAAYTGISRQTLYRMIARNELPGAMKIGGVVRVDKQALDKWIDEQRAA